METQTKNEKKTKSGNSDDPQKNLLHFSICACHPCAGAMLIFSVSFQFYRMIPEGNPCSELNGTEDHNTFGVLPLAGVSRLLTSSSFVLCPSKRSKLAFACRSRGLKFPVFSDLGVFLAIWWVLPRQLSPKTRAHGHRATLGPAPTRVGECAALCMELLRRFLTTAGLGRRSICLLLIDILKVALGFFIAVHKPTCRVPQVPGVSRSLWRLRGKMLKLSWSIFSMISLPCSFPPGFFKFASIPREVTQSWFRCQLRSRECRVAV